MRLIKVGIINTNPTVGAFQANTMAFCNFAKQAAEQKVSIAVGGEALIGGYSPEDLLDWADFVDNQSSYLVDFAKFTKKLDFPTIFVVGLFMRLSGENYNAAAVVCNGKIYGGHFKENLPTYSVFREGRKCSPGSEGVAHHFVPGVSEFLHKDAAFGDVMFSTPFGVVSVDDCEDLWNPDGPLHRRAYSGSELNCTVNASPFRFGVVNTRREMQATRSADNNIAQVSSYIVGGNDGLVFDGGGFVFVNGKPITEAPRWHRKGVLHTAVIDLDAVTTARAANTTWRLARAEFLRHHEVTDAVEISDGPEPNQPEYKVDNPPRKNFFVPALAENVSAIGEYFDDMEDALVMGTVDYYQKVGVYKCMGNAGSGGTDSAITSIILAQAMRRVISDEANVEGVALSTIGLLPERVTIFSMPSQHNSGSTKSMIKDLADQLGVGFKEIPIQEAYERELSALASMLPPGTEIPSITKQNIQVRIRFSRMWNWSNAVSGFFPQNSNMSEKAVGYCTIGGGDIEGHLSLIANVPKSVAKMFLYHLANKYELPAARAIAESKASAELEENQEDEKDLMPFPVMDACLQLFAGDKLMPLDVYRRVRDMFTDAELKQMRPDYKPGMLKSWVKRFVTLFMRSIYKWVRSPLSLHLGSTDLERERAMELPVVQSMEWLLESMEAIDREND